MTAIEETKTISLGIVGGGFMGEAILRGLLERGTVQGEGVCIGEPVAARRALLADAFPGAQLAEDGAGAAAGREVILLSVKPQDFPRAASVLRGVLRADQLVLSIMAGVRLESLCEQLRHERVVRAIPNTPASVGEGFTGWISAAAVDEAARESVRRILGAIGREVEVHEERYIDMLTAISSSGVGYVFLFIEALIDAGVHIGMPRPIATDAVLQTVLGSVTMAMADERHPAQLRNMVTSAGGTTAAGLHMLERSALRAALTEAVIAAYERSRALGG